MSQNSYYECEKRGPSSSYPTRLGPSHGEIVGNNLCDPETSVDLSTYIEAGEELLSDVFPLTQERVKNTYQYLPSEGFPTSALYGYPHSMVPDRRMGGYESGGVIVKEETRGSHRAVCNTLQYQAAQCAQTSMHLPPPMERVHPTLRVLKVRNVCHSLSIIPSSSFTTSFIYNPSDSKPYLLLFFFNHKHVILTYTAPNVFFFGPPPVVLAFPLLGVPR